MSVGMPLRDERVMRYVTAFCPECHRESPEQNLANVRRLSGYIAERDGKAWLVRGCPDHGRITTLYDEQPEILRWLEQWTAPTKVHIPDTPGNRLIRKRRRGAAAAMSGQPAGDKRRCL